MALQFPPTDTLPAPTTGTLWTDPNGLVWRATVQDVSGTSVTSWTPDSQIEAGAFQYRGFADLTQPIPDADVALGNLYSVQNNVTAANINPEWGGLSAASGGTADMEANQLIICTQDTLGGNPRYTWAPVATPASPWLRDGGVIRPVNQGDDLEVKFNGVAGGDILIENYEELP